jgi:FKBP-type peptidyl-prolyl cis-trans isomerase FklB
MDIGSKLKSQDFDVEPALVAQGLKDAMLDNKALMSKKEVQDVLMAFQKQLMEEQRQRQKELAAKNAQAGKEFLEANAAKEDVQTTETGLQYRIKSKGDGPQPDIDDVVTVHYTGKLVNGTVFDTSHEDQKPATFPVKGVIPGWTEALQMMHQGGEWELFIPADLAYGERPAGPMIGPNSTLVFDVQLLEVQEKQPKEAKEGQAGAK